MIKSCVQNLKQFRVPAKKKYAVKKAIKEYREENNVTIFLFTCEQFNQSFFTILRNLFLCQDCWHSDLPPHLEHPCYVASLLCSSRAGSWFGACNHQYGLRLALSFSKVLDQDSNSYRPNMKRLAAIFNQSCWQLKNLAGIHYCCFLF